MYILLLLFTVKCTSDAPSSTPEAYQAPVKKPITLQGPKPKKFEVPEGELGSVISAAMTNVPRLYTGTLAEGYSVKLGTKAEG